MFRFLHLRLFAPISGRRLYTRMLDIWMKAEN